MRKERFNGNFLLASKRANFYTRLGPPARRLNISHLDRSQTSAIRTITSRGPEIAASLERDVDCYADARVPLVVHVIPIVFVDNVNVVCFVPIVRPIARPRVNKGEPIAAVLKARKSTNNHVRLAEDDERVAPAKVGIVMVVRDAVALVAAALLPCAVV